MPASSRTHSPERRLKGGSWLRCSRRPQAVPTSSATTAAAASSFSSSPDDCEARGQGGPGHVGAPQPRHTLEPPPLLLSPAPPAPARELTARTAPSHSTRYPSCSGIRSSPCVSAVVCRVGGRGSDIKPGTLLPPARPHSLTMTAAAG